MMSKTIDQISTSVLKKLGRLPDGQVAPASQLKTVEEEYNELYDELLNDSLVNWAANDDIPEFASGPIKILLLGRVAADFGVPDIWSPREEQQRKKLSSQITSEYVSQTTTFESF